MHLKSSHRPSESTQLQDVPVIIFKRGEKRKFLKRPDTYEDMVRVVRRKFDIAEYQTPIFETRSLEVCQNHSIEIDEEVYPLIVPSIDEIEVLLPGSPWQSGNGAASYAEPQWAGGSGVEDIQMKYYEQEPDVLMHGAGDTADINSERKAKGKGKARDDILDSDTDTVIPAHRRPNAAPSNSNFDDGKPKSKSKSTKEKETTKTKKRQQNLEDILEIDGDAATSPKRNKPSKTKSKPKPEIEAGSDRDDARPATARSSMRRRTASLQPSRFDNDAGADNEIEELPPHTHDDVDGEDQQHHGHQQDDPAGLFDDEIVEIERVPRRENEPDLFRNAMEEMEVDEQLVQETKHVKVKKEFAEDENNRNAGPSNSSGRGGRGTGSVAPSPTKGSSSKTTKNGTEPSRQTPLRVHDTWDQSQGQSQSQDPAEDGTTEDGRFKVFIEGPEGETNRAEFMTRTRHPVRKVLQGACRHFGVDPKKAQLQLLIDGIGEDGETVTHYFKCPKDDTMGMAGVNAFASLRVTLESEDEEEY